MELDSNGSPRRLTATNGGSLPSYGGIVNELFEGGVVTNQPTTSNGIPMNGVLPKKFDVDPLIIGLSADFRHIS